MSGSRPKDPATRFAKYCKTNKNGCVEWVGYRMKTGYGIFRAPLTGNAVLAHRWAWQALHGPIESTTLVCHHCDNPSCVNVDHLFVGSHQDNTDDRVNKRRHNTAHFGTRNGKSKLDPVKVRAIRAASAKGRSYAALGREYGVTYQSVRAVCLRRNWAHVK